MKFAWGQVIFRMTPNGQAALKSPKKADLLLHDGAYTLAEYEEKTGWGHSAIQDTIEFANMCKVKHLGIFHHEPNNTDSRLDEILAERLAGKVLDFFGRNVSGGC